ncbi:MAG: PilZ domain-containing protein [Acidobacteriota bacterium]|jgi:c-di-GMP-binding flagellar brake protein YcgR
MIKKKDERRKHIRVLPEHNYPISVDINGENFIEVLKAIDISEGGVGISVPSELKGCYTDMPVTLVISLPQPVEYLFSVLGKIKHVANKKFGVIFLNLDKTSLMKIRQYIAYRIKSESWIMYLKYKLRLILKTAGVHFIL